MPCGVHLLFVPPEIHQEGEGSGSGCITDTHLYSLFAPSRQRFTEGPITASGDPCHCTGWQRQEHRSSPSHRGHPGLWGEGRVLGWRAMCTGCCRARAPSLTSWRGWWWSGSQVWHLLAGKDNLPARAPSPVESHSLFHLLIQGD